MQAKRIQVAEANGGAGVATSVALNVPSDPREEINFHNIWASATGEPQDADANAQYTWVLFVLRVNQTLPTFTDAVTNAEGNNPLIIACGVGSGSNQSPFNSGPISIKTSRTLQAGDALVMQLIATGLTAGLSSNRIMLCAHTTRK